ncbi:MAG: hypothetical protein JXR48_04320 [Candidatus Delongbacteria bacterium]|nr:hypothetical protein [Candidatus Delongbacteria bacterium]MBN2834172.1 hypothetical protein [Candidatus Delongbacteria bacterium]
MSLIIAHITNEQELTLEHELFNLKTYFDFENKEIANADIIIVDNDFDLIEFKRNKKQKILLCGNFSDNYLLQKMRKDKYDSVIIKPYTMKDLVYLVDNLYG